MIALSENNKKIILALVSLHALALSTSIAVMEFTTTVLILFSVFFFVTQYKIISTNRMLRTQSDLWIGGFFLAILASYLWNWAEVIEPITKTFRFTRWILIFYMWVFVFRILKNNNVSTQSIIKTWGIGVIAAGVYSLAQFIWGVDLFHKSKDIVKQVGEFWRATGFFSISLTFAYVIGMSGFLTFPTLLNKIKYKVFDRTFYFYFTTFIASGIGIFVSLTRGAWLGFALSFMVGVFIFKRSWIVPAILFVVVLGTAGFTLNSSFRERAKTLFSSDNHSNQWRTIIWHSNWEIFKDHPILGVGLGENAQMLPQYYDKLGYKNVGFIGHAHNNFIQMLSGLGLVGFIFFCGMVLSFLKISYKKFLSLDEPIKWLALGTLVAQIFFHLGGLTESSFNDTEVNHTLIVIWALITVA